jgi:DNA-binding CsgD family transcriptional regulator
VRWAWSGRDEELGVASELLVRTRCLIVSADPGSGRSRFVRELGQVIARDARATVATTVASGALSGVALGALASLLPASPADAEATNDIVLRSAASLERRFRGGGGVIVIDDAHLLDDVSIEVVHAVLARSGVDVSWVLTLDERAPVTNRLAELWRSDLAEVMRLPPMRAEQIQTMARVDRDAALRLHERTGGLALLVHELVEAQRATTGGSGSKGLDAPRLRHAVERVTGALNSGEQTVVEFLSFVGRVPARLLTSYESVIAGLERRGVVASDGSTVWLSIPLVGEVTAASLTERRRWALYSVMVARFGDVSSAIDVELFHLATWDSLGTRTFPAARYLAATRWALDAGLAEAAVQLHRAASAASTPLASTQRALELVSIEIGVAADPERALAQLTRMLADEPVDGSGRVQMFDDGADVLDAVIAMVRRGHLPIDGASELVEFKRDRCRGDRERARVALALSQVAWLSGEPAVARATLQSFDSRSLDRNGAAAWRMVDVAVGAELADSRATARRARIAARSVTAPASRDARVVGLAGALAELFDRDRAVWDVRRDGAEGLETPDLGPQELVAEMVRSAVRGAVADARAIARRLQATDYPVGAGFDELGSLVRILATDEEALPAAPGESAAFGPRLRGVWTRWVDAASVAVAMTDGTLVGDTERLDMASELARRHLASASWATGATIAHHLLRCGPDNAVIELFDEVAAAETDSAVLGAMCDHAIGVATREPSSLLRAGSVFSAQQWDASAADAFGAAAVELGRVGDSAGSLAALLAHADAARRADPSAVFSAGATAEYLTPRESDVALLAAVGLASKEVARRLGVSPRTVDNHLYRLSQRFGINGRRDLSAAWATASSLLGDAIR